jgi:RNA 2',3'-cyclic 3'-phosphodiesterase
MVRLFVGIGFPEDIRERLSGLCGGVPGARWVPPENFHLTLRFIGEVDGGDAEDIYHALMQVRPPRFDLTLSGVGHFGSGTEVRSLWVGIERNPELLALRDRVDSALARAGVERDGRRYTPHVTLGRLRDTPLPRVSAFLSHHALFRAGPIPVEHFTLFSSFQQGTGPIYTPEADYLLPAVTV